jgi:DoxX-like family
MEGERSGGRQWAGRVLSALAVVFLLLDSAIKLLAIAPVLDSFGRLGYPAGVATGIGILELACVVLYVIRPVAVPGAVLLIGFLGGAVASHVRVGDPLFSHVLFPTYVGALLWAGLVLRDKRLQTLFAWKGVLR